MKNYVDKDKLQEYTTKLNAKMKTIFATKSEVGSPLKASTVAEMTDESRIYVYTGSESGYTAGNWYYYDGSAWTSGGVYNSTAFETDATLAVPGMAADAKAVGDALANVEIEVDATLTQAGMAADAKAAGDAIGEVEGDVSNLKTQLNNALTIVSPTNTDKVIFNNTQTFLDVIDFSNVVVREGANSYVINAKCGERYKILGASGSSYRLYSVCSTYGNVISKADANITEAEVIIPYDCVLVINDLSGAGSVQKFAENIESDVIDSVLTKYSLGYFNTQGERTTSDSWYISQPVYVNGYNYLVYTGILTAGTNPMAVFKDENGNVISTFHADTGTNKVNVPGNAYSVSFSLYKSDIDNGLEIKVSAIKYGSDSTLMKGFAYCDNVLNSWWCVPRNKYDAIMSKVWAGGITRNGMIGIAELDIRHGTGRFVPLGISDFPDDHNVPAFLMQNNKPVIAAYNLHGTESKIHFFKSDLPFDIDSLAENETILEPQNSIGTFSYAQFIKALSYPNKIALLFRASGIGWAKLQSEDYGDTWTTTADKLHDKPYCTNKLSGTGATAYYATAFNPMTPDITRTIHRFDVKVETGEIWNISGTPITDDGGTNLNFWTSNCYVKDSKASLVCSFSGDNTVRLFDVSNDGKAVAVMPFSVSHPENGGVYTVYRYSNGSWTAETLCESGKPFGYYQSSYVGGMCFGKDSNTIFLIREKDGTWYAEKWICNSGTWSLDTVIEQAIEYKLGRIQIPDGANDLITTYGRYYHYKWDSYEDYMGDQMAIAL